MEKEFYYEEKIYIAKLFLIECPKCSKVKD